VNEEFILCPLVDKLIEVIDCIENRDLAESSVPNEYKKKNNWKEICKKCKYFNY